MNKKTNTVLFLIGATVFNMVLTVTSFVLIMAVFGRVIVPLFQIQSETIQNIGVLVFGVSFFAAIAIAFVVYRFAVKLLLSKIDAEKVFDPLIKPRRRPPNRRD